MRGIDAFQESLFTTVHLNSFAPNDHLLRSIKIIINQALSPIDWLLSYIYSESGRGTNQLQLIISVICWTDNR